MSTFEELERLNALIDIYIDEEEYEQVYQALPIPEPLTSLIESCLGDPNCTQDKDHEWQTILSRDLSLPIEKAHPTNREGNDIPLDKLWSRLFYAKRLRARIQQKATDCYLRRLDDVVAYLENNLPAVSHETAKLAVLYLLEMSATSQSFEILAFADRARRIINERPGILGDDAEEFRSFYDLLAGYNLGIGYFHKSRYRKAIVEFNRIIKQVQEAKKTNKKTQLCYFEERYGYRLLYLPAVIYRADVQLRLQLAYHALDTINKYFQSPEAITVYKQIRGQLIEAEAYQQMGRLDEEGSWKRLNSAYILLPTLNMSPDELKERMNQAKPIDGLGKRMLFKTLPYRLFQGQRQNIKGKFLHFYVEDHLEWLEQSSRPYAGDWDQLIVCSKMLRGMFNLEWFELVQFHARSRNGYYQQLAKFLAWLARTEEPDLRDMAKNLYFNRGVGMLKKPNDAKCALCKNRGVDLRSMNPQYYSWFKDSMLKFFEALQKSLDSNKQPKKSMENELKKFVRAFIEQEHNGVDLRINDLNLHYQLEKPEVELIGDTKRCYGDNTCTGDKSAFQGLLDGTGSDVSAKGEPDKRLKSGEYLQVMQKWDESYLRQLKSRSNHSGHKKGLYLIGLQRWNSSSPAQGRSVGGGYLLYHTDDKGAVDLGVAIDPGFDFVRNLFHMGFSISDIDIVLISHSHVDHVRDFESMVQLLADLKDKGKRQKYVHVILSLGVYERLKHIIEDPFYRYHVEPYIIDAHREIELGYFEELESGKPFRFIKRLEEGKHKQGLIHYRAVLPGEELPSPVIEVKIQPTRAYHIDPTHYSDSFGFLVTVSGLSQSSGNDGTTLGYTGDTKWVYPTVTDPRVQSRDARHKIKDVSEQYKCCNAVIVHLGSLVGTEEGIRNEFMNCEDCKKEELPECRNLVCKENHPYLVGLLRMLSTLRSKAEKGNLKQLVLVSEFGEELRGGIRSDLIQRLRDYYKGTLSFLPIDVGMEVELWSEEKPEAGADTAKTEQKVWCVQCERFVDIGYAEFERYGVDEALFCVCQTCRKATPLNVMQDRLRQLYEVGRELKTLDE